MSMRHVDVSLQASRLASWALLLTGGFVLVAWWVGFEPVTRPHGTLASMKAPTAFCFVLLGGSLRHALPGGRARLRLAFGLGAVAIASAVTLEYVTGRSFGLDELLARDLTVTHLPKGRPAPVTAGAILLVGTALALAQRGRQLLVGELFALVAAALAFVSLCGHLFGVRSLYDVASYGSIAPETTVALLVASAGAIASHPGRGLFAALTGETFASRLLRAGLPALLVGPLLVGWVIKLGVGRRYDAGFALAVFTTVTVGLLAAVFTSIATALYRIELAERVRLSEHAAGELRAAEDRERLLERITAANVELEERVRERTQELSTRLREREVLLQEVQHRVNNNLQLMTSLIGLQLEGVVEAESRAALLVCQNRMAAIVVVHRSSYASGDYSRVDFLACVRAIAAHVLGVAAAGARIRLECEGQLSLPVSQAIPGGLIVNELVSNAVLHAFPGARGGCVHVTLETEPDGGAALVVADDGVGMAPARAEPPAQTVGLMLVKSLTEQLEGRLEVEAGAGTSVRVTFPLA